MKQVKCKSGVIGWQAKLQKVYNSKSEFITYCRTWRTHTRLGFSTPSDAWKSNPTIQGSVVPSDLCIVQ